MALLLRMQRFPSLAARETCVAETNFAARKQKKVFAWSQMDKRVKAWLNKETLLRMQRFPSLAARETCVAETNFAARKQKMFLPGVKNIFASRTQILRPKHMLPSLATPGNITRNNVSATMFPSLARP